MPIYFLSIEKGLNKDIPVLSSYSVSFTEIIVLVTKTGKV